MLIQVHEHYRGATTDERLIVPGTYALNDPALFGCEDVLIATGKATLIDPPKPIEPEPQPEEKPAAKRTTRKG